MRFLTPAEVTTLADAIKARYRALVLVGAYGGLRIGELAGLRRGRVDLLRGTVTVAEIVVEVRGVLHIGPPKTRASRRLGELHLDRYGHLYPESDAALRDRLDALYSAGQRDQDAAVVALFQEGSRPQRHPRTRGIPPPLDR
jgi:integrase